MKTSLRTGPVSQLYLIKNDQVKIQ